MIPVICYSPRKCRRSTHAPFIVDILTRIRQSAESSSEQTDARADLMVALNNEANLPEKRLSFIGTEHKPGDMAEIIRALEDKPMIEGFRIIKWGYHLNQNEADFNSLIEFLKTQKTVSWFKFLESKMSDEQNTALIQALHLGTNDALTYLDLSDMNMQDSQIEVLAADLKQNKTLCHLNLGYNPIMDNGAIALAEAVKGHDTLQKLNLESNQISNEGARALTKALSQNKVQEKLVLVDNFQMKNQGFKDLSKALEAKARRLHPEKQDQIWDPDGDGFYESASVSQGVTQSASVSQGVTQSASVKSAEKDLITRSKWKKVAYKGAGVVAGGLVIGLIVAFSAWPVVLGISVVAGAIAGGYAAFRWVSSKQASEQVLPKEEETFQNEHPPKVTEPVQKESAKKPVITPREATQDKNLAPKAGEPKGKSLR